MIEKCIQNPWLPPPISKEKEIGKKKQKHKQIRKKIKVFINKRKISLIHRNLLSQIELLAQ